MVKQQRPPQTMQGRDRPWPRRKIVLPSYRLALEACQERFQVGSLLLSQVVDRQGVISAGKLSEDHIG
jgi:hypothetical protein